MLDKLQLKFPFHLNFHPDLFPRCDQAGHTHSRHASYSWFSDLRSTGLPVTFYFRNRWTGDHKIEIHEVWHRSAQEILDICQQVIIEDPMPLPVMRLDLAADVPGLTVAWFRGHMVAKHKRRNTYYLKQNPPSLVEGSESLPSFRLETSCFGRSNRYVVYDKLQELEAQARAGRLSEANAKLLGWYKATGQPYTRVERQCQSRVPKELKTLDALFANASTFDPFSALELLPGAPSLPDLENYSPSNLLQGLGVYFGIQKFGIQEFRAMLNKRGGHANEILQRFGAFIPGDPAGFQIPDLRQLYQSSLRLGPGPATDAIPLGLSNWMCPAVTAPVQ